MKYDKRPPFDPDNSPRDYGPPDKSNHNAENYERLFGRPYAGGLEGEIGWQELQEEMEKIEDIKNDLLP